MVTRYGAVVLFCLTLGLAPFMPEPHLVGKLRWVAGGAVGMGAMDGFDLLMHGAPWLVLVGMGVYDVARVVIGRTSGGAEDGASPTMREPD